MKALQTIDIGDSVCCDSCGDEYRGNPATGGLLFQSKAICPVCAPKWERDAALYNETHLIRGRCPLGVTFHSFVMGLRGGDNKITVYEL